MFMKPRGAAEPHDIRRRRRRRRAKLSDMQSVMEAGGRSRLVTLPSCLLMPLCRAPRGVVKGHGKLDPQMKTAGLLHGSSKDANKCSDYYE